MNDVLKPFLLHSKVALVTGASSGLGRHFATVLAQAGAKVVLCARRQEPIEASCAEIIKAGGEAIAVPMDVTNSTSVATAFAEAERAFGVVTVVINNAGISVPNVLLNMKDDDWQNVIDTNLNGVMYVSREAGRRMVVKESAGSIVNIASITAQRAQQALTNYGAAKAGVVQFTKVAALEFARYKIRVNALCPGYFATDLTRDWLKTEEGLAMTKTIPQRRTGELDELNGPLLLLASDAGSFMTGSTITIDGGQVL